MCVAADRAAPRSDVRPVERVSVLLAVAVVRATAARTGPPRHGFGRSYFLHGSVLCPCVIVAAFSRARARRCGAQPQTLRRYEKAFELNVRDDCSDYELALAVGRCASLRAACCCRAAALWRRCTLARVLLQLNAAAQWRRRCRHFEATLEVEDEDCLSTFMKAVRRARCVPCGGAASPRPSLLETVCQGFVFWLSVCVRSPAAPCRLRRSPRAGEAQRRVDGCEAAARR
jgi:hypothetical protein